MHSLQLVIDGFVLPNPHPRHLLEHPLSVKRFEAVDLQLRVPNVFERLRRLVDLQKDYSVFLLAYSKYNE